VPPSDATLASSNALLDSLPKADRHLILDACTQTELAFGATVCKPNDPITHVYFPTASYISLITPADAAESLEVGMVGREGMFGITLMLGVKASPLLGLVQGGGASLRMTARAFLSAIDESSPFRQRLELYLFVLTGQLAQTAACNRFHTLDTRMARWLLMTQDRAFGDSFRLTHQFLAYMLGVRRAGVTEVAGRFQARGLIRYSRGVLTIRDRPALEAVSCPCYGALRTTYRKYLGESASSASGPGARKVFGRRQG
jgi:CRP-like cAMP-binding protein